MPYTPKDFTFVLCAYQECEYLEESIRSVVNQTVPVRAIIITSTPNDYIRRFALQYGLEVRVNEKGGGHAADYNFALEQVDTPLGAMAHQDDVLTKDYVENCLAYLNRSRNPQLYITNYAELHEGEIVSRNQMLRIKRLMLLPLRVHCLQGLRWVRRLVISIGNPICHPTVTYVMDKMPPALFRKQYRSDMDWDVWERLSREKGAFVYCPKVQLYHRMHKGQATAVLVGNTSRRRDEDMEMMHRFWPMFIVRFLMRFYSKSEEFY